jgi:hypothetical protein
MSNGKNMTDEQIKILFDFVCSKPICVQDMPNPFVYGQPWAIGNSYSEAQKQAFVDRWAKFAAERPDIWALMPLRDAEEKT